MAVDIGNKELAQNWFRLLRDEICREFEAIESNWADEHNLPCKKFERTEWTRDGGGGGQMSIMRGNVFEKVGVNISSVYGEFSKEFAKQVPGTENDPSFFATGISLVAHMKSPLIPAAHFNTRFIVTSKHWFGGGGDLTPTFPDERETQKFHFAFKNVCDKYGEDLYKTFKENCDEYFFLEHRKEPRGVGGIFFDYYNTGNFDEDFRFVQDVGSAFKDIYVDIVRSKLYDIYTEAQREALLIKRGRYVEFNLLYDRGTKFGLMTNGNTEAILMSLPPEVKWP
ncbi:MAG: oxygen-dependent coproporphyrinogen oxidase [Rickettsiaceae bacterium]|nr:oxygen-dependent coproporphyrinogen oxidase [Rickettsiaceae bacterium]